MDTTEFQSYVTERYEKQVAWYDDKAKRNRRLYLSFQWLLIILSAVTPVLVAADGQRLRWPAIVVSGLVAIGTTGLKTFQFHEHWVNYRTTCETLRKEIYYYMGHTSAYANAADPEGLFVERVEALISRENTMWLATTAQEDQMARQKKTSGRSKSDR